MTLTPLYWLAAAVLALLYLPRVLEPPGRTRTMLKTLSVVALALVALIGGGPLLLVGALLLCAGGDALLSRDGEGALKAGMLAFAAGHLVYIALFLNAGGGLGVDVVRILLQIAIVLAAAGLTAWLWPSLGPMRGPVAGYVAVVTIMTLLAVGLPPGVWLVTLGALLFMTSDALLAGELFRLSPDDPARRWTAPTVWSLYWGGQAAITAGFLYPLK
jgi:uncharacterized membrane protein YhhN